MGSFQLMYIHAGHDHDPLFSTMQCTGHNPHAHDSLEIYYFAAFNEFLEI